MIADLISWAGMHVITFGTRWAFNLLTVIGEYQILTMTIAFTEHVRHVALRVIYAGAAITNLTLRTFASGTRVEWLHAASVLADELTRAGMHVIAFRTHRALNLWTVVWQH